MSPSSVQISLGGRRYRIASSVAPERLAQLVERVERKMSEVGKGHPEAMSLVALALAHDAYEAEERLRVVVERQEQAIASLLARVDRSLGYVDENGNPLDTAAAAAVGVSRGQQDFEVVALPKNQVGARSRS